MFVCLKNDKVNDTIRPENYKKYDYYNGLRVENQSINCIKNIIKFFLLVKTTTGPLQTELKTPVEPLLATLKK